MKTKKFYSYLIAAFCCLCAVFALTSCHPDDEEDDNNGNGSETIIDYDYIEDDNGNENNSDKNIGYVEFKEPCLIKGATREEVMAWMKANMPEYEIESLAVDDSGWDTYVHKDNPSIEITYSFYHNRLYTLQVYGPFQIEKVLELLDKRYGRNNRVDSSQSITEVTVDSYIYLVSNADVSVVGVAHTYGMDTKINMGTITQYYRDDVGVQYRF